MISAYISPLKTCSEPTDSLYLCVNLNINTIMKKNMKKLLVIALALMPSLSILAINPSGIMIVPDEPDNIPIVPDPNTGVGGGGPRIQSVGPSDIPVIPAPLPGGTMPRIQSNEPNDIPIKSNPGTGIPGPRIRQDIDPNLIPIKPVPGPGTGHEPRIRSVVQDPECYHYDGVVYIYADATVTFITATITRIGDNPTWTGSTSTNTLTISASSAIGVYRLELTLSDGRSFIGEYIIE